MWKVPQRFGVSDYRLDWINSFLTFSWRRARQTDRYHLLSASSVSCDSHFRQHQPPPGGYCLPIRGDVLSGTDLRSLMMTLGALDVAGWDASSMTDQNSIKSSKRHAMRLLIPVSNPSSLKATSWSGRLHFWSFRIFGEKISSLFIYFLCC